MKNKTSKKTSIIILTAFLLSIPITQVYAYTFDVKFANIKDNSNTGGSSSSGKPTNKDNKVAEGYKKDGKVKGDNITTLPNKKIKEKWSCYYKYNTSSTNEITINGYNRNNEEITSKNSLKIKEKVLAGTSIGLDIYETKIVGYEVIDVVVEYKKETSDWIQIGGGYNKCTGKGTCQLTKCKRGTSTSYSNETTKQECQKDSNKYRCEMNFNENCTWVEAKYDWSDPKVEKYDIRKSNSEDHGSKTKEKYSDCEKAAFNAAQTEANSKLGASYQVEIPDSNNAKSNTSKKISGAAVNCKSLTKKEKIEKCEKFTFTGKKDNKYTLQIEYEYRTNPCMNVITSEVKYVSNSKYCNDDNEVLIANDTNEAGRAHWHYFVPLNTKSKDKKGKNNTVNIALSKKNSQNLKFEQCIYVLENNYVEKDSQSNKTDYTDLIKSGNGETLNGDYKCELRNGKKICDKKLQSTSDYLKLKKNGCYLTSVIKIPINQKFYQEEQDNDGNIKFTGFNFYYRPININDPFPNGFSENSYWKQWDKDGRKDPNMAESYKITTYSAININTQTVRNYKNTTTDGEQNTYSSWNNMTKAGKSNFISNQGVVTRHKTGDYYKIGEGPSVTIKNGQAIMTGSDN